MKNLFEQAINKNELLEFSVGSGEYFIADRDYGEHWVLASWQRFILPYMNEVGEGAANAHITKMLVQMIKSSSYEIATKGDFLLYHVHVYYYFKKEGQVLMDVVLNIEQEVMQLINSYCDHLFQNDKIKLAAVVDAIKLIKSRDGLRNYQSVYLT